jgi:membrane protein DedA with SNARE-associated domain
MARDPERAARRRKLAWLVVPMIAFAVSANVANAFSPTLLVREPVWLIALSSRIRWLVLVSPRLDPLTFFAIPMARLMAVAAVYYVFGGRYGDRAVRWIESKMGGGSSKPILWIERQFHRARYPVIFLLPAGPFVSLLAGADKMPPKAYYATTVAGLLARLLVIRLVAEAFSGVILDVTDWIADNQVWLTAVSFLTVAAFALWGQRSGRTEIESVDEIAEELGET